MKKLIIFFFFITILIKGQSDSLKKDYSVKSTHWLFEKINVIDENIVNSTYLISCPKTKSKGSGFLLKNGVIITNAHVIKNEDLKNIYAISSFGVEIQFEKVIIDTVIDLAALITKKQLPPGGLSLAKHDDILIGEQVKTWGFPLGYNGPAPILCVGNFAGFSAYNFESKTIKDTIKKTIKRYVINAAFNSGNSGGALFKANSDSVIGVVVSKALPITNEFLDSAIKFFSLNSSGFQFPGISDTGEKKSYSESQVVAEVVNNLIKMYQVVIGEAIGLCDIENFLTRNNINNVK